MKQNATAKAPSKQDVIKTILQVKRKATFVVTQVLAGNNLEGNSKA